MQKDNNKRKVNENFSYLMKNMNSEAQEVQCPNRIIIYNWNDSIIPKATMEIKSTRIMPSKGSVVKNNGFSSRRPGFNS